MDKEYLAKKKYVDGEVNTNVAYGTCTTPATTTEKTVSIVNNPNWKLQPGSIIVVKFSYTNTAQNPKLKVGTYDAKPILYGTAAITTTNLGYGGYENAYIEYMYNGTHFIFVGWSFDSNNIYTNATLGQVYGTCTTSEATTAKTVTSNDYELSTGGIVAIKFINNVPAGSTLNINNKGPKAIYHKGTAITDGIIKAGNTATFIYSDQYHLIAIDRNVAISAEKLTKDAGSVNTPVYFNDGKPIECDYTLGSASTKQYTSDIIQGNENLITSGAVYEAVTELDKKTDATNIVVGDLADNLQGAYNQINSLKNTISPLQDNVSALIDEKNIMGSRLTKAETDIDNLQTNVSNLQTNVNDLNDEKNIMGSRLTKAETNINNVKTTAETAKTKATEALARNIFTDEEKAKLANITNPMIIKGRVDTVNDLPTEAEIGWFYFVGLESASSYEEYCYSETGWEYVGLSQDGIDLSNYYTKAQVDSKEQTLIGDIQGNAAAIEILNRDVGDSVAGIYSEINSVKNTISPLQDNVSALIDEKNILGSRLTKAETTLGNVKTTAETAETKADNALTQADSNTTNINTLKTDVNALKAVDERIWTNLDTINKTASTAKTKAEEGVAKADNALTATRTNATNISTHETRLDSIDNTLSSHDTRITTAQQKANSVDEKVDATNKVVGQLSTSLQSAYNKINAHANDIAINRTTLGTQCKNLHDTLSVNWYQPDKISMASNGTVTATITSDTRNFTYANSEHYITLEAGNYIITVNTLEFVSGSAALIRGCNSDNQSLFALSVSSAGLHKAAFSLSKKTTIGIMYKLYSQTCTIMIRDADILDDTYEVYKANVNERLIENKSNIAINKSTLGYQRKNLLKNETGTTTMGGVTFTHNSDGSVTLNGTSDGQHFYTLMSKDFENILGKKCILTGCPANGSNSTFGIYIRTDIDDYIYDSGAGVTFTTDSIIWINIVVRSGVTFNNVTFYPMLRYADITDSTYEPYQPSLLERCLLKDTAGIALGAASGSSITIDNLSSYTALWVNVSGNVSGINFQTNLVVPVAYLAKSTSNRVQLAGGIPSSAYITSEGAQAAKNMDGTITAKVSGNTLDLTIGTGTIGSIEVISLM